MISSKYDPGPKGAFRRLCREYPGADVYGKGFRTKWGPIFYRGRLDGSARLLVIGQDPAQHEAVLRRIFAGQAGRRVQGFVHKLGFTKSYVMMNTFVYGIYNQSMALPHIYDPEILEYRHRWLDAILAPGKIEAVVAFGYQAHKAWLRYRQAEQIQSSGIAYCHVLHPTSPGKGSPLITTAKMLANWNKGLRKLHPQISNPDVEVPLVPYGEELTAEELPPIPSADLPPGTPAWMCEDNHWALMASPAGSQRANVVIKCPYGS